MRGGGGGCGLKQDIKKKKKKKKKKKIREKSRKCKSQTAALPRHQEGEEIDKAQQAQIEHTYKK